VTDDAPFCILIHLTVYLAWLGRKGHNTFLVEYSDMIDAFLFTHVPYDGSQRFTVGFVHCIAGGFQDGVGKVGGMNYFATMEIITDNRVQDQATDHHESGNGKADRNQGFPRERVKHTILRLWLSASISRLG
jgi:hypothetical protein